MEQRVNPATPDSTEAVRHGDAPEPVDAFQLDPANARSVVACLLRGLARGSERWNRKGTAVGEWKAAPARIPSAARWLGASAGPGRVRADLTRDRARLAHGHVGVRVGARQARARTAAASRVGVPARQVALPQVVAERVDVGDVVLAEEVEGRACLARARRACGAGAGRTAVSARLSRIGDRRPRVGS